MVPLFVLGAVLGAILLLIIAYLVYDKMTRTDTSELPTDPHFAAWVKCVSSNDPGDDSLLDVDGGPYKDEWIACRSSGAPASD